MKNTHFVIKREDYKTPRVLELLGKIVQRNRTEAGKDPNPTYIVINTDEPYVDEVIEVLKKHGHWEEDE